jgi:hypothetical protein
MIKLIHAKSYCHHNTVWKKPLYTNIIWVLAVLLNKYNCAYQHGSNCGGGCGDGDGESWGGGMRLQQNLI